MAIRTNADVIVRTTLGLSVAAAGQIFFFQTGFIPKYIVKWQGVFYFFHEEPFHIEHYDVIYEVPAP